MFKIRNILIMLGILSYPIPSNAIQLSIGIGLPNVSLAINMPAYPELVVVPGYPVYYAPRLNANYFFYDGLYWVYQDDDWYVSSWYNGPWSYVEPEAVPLYILRVPVRYYRQPPTYFMGWYSNSAPRWGDYWGNDWEQHRSGWDRWDRKAAPPPAPLPIYQRQYSGERYPRPVQQQELQKRHYNYQPREHFEPNERIERREDTRQRGYIEQRDAPRRQDAERQQNINRQQNNAPFVQRIPGQQVNPTQESPRAPADRRDRPQENQRPPAMQQAPQPAPRPPQPIAGQREQQEARPRQQEDRQQNRNARGEQNRGQEQDKGQEKNRERERN